MEEYEKEGWTKDDWIWLKMVLWGKMVCAWEFVMEDRDNWKSGMRMANSE